MTSPEQIETHINKFLQSSLIFSLENKILKRGKLILFSIKDFYCIFTIICQEKNNKKIIFEIPYPFHFTNLQDKVIFDYTLKTFINENSQIDNILKKLITKKPSKFLNKKIVVSLAS